MFAGVLRRMCRRRGVIDDIEAALIDEAIALAWAEAGNTADLGHVKRQLESRGDRRAADMAIALGPWCPGGALGRLFAGAEPPRLDAAFTVFELGELKGRHDVQGVVLMLVVFLATQRMYHGARTVPKAIVIGRGLGPALRRGQPLLPRGCCQAGAQVPRFAGHRHPIGQRLLRQSGRPRGLGQRRLDPLPRPEGRVGRAAQAGKAHPLRSRHGARAQEPRHRRRAPCRAGAARPGWMAGSAPGARSMVDRALLLARPHLRRRRAVEVAGAHHAPGHRPAGRDSGCARPGAWRRGATQRVRHRRSGHKEHGHGYRIAPFFWPQ